METTELELDSKEDTELYEHQWREQILQREGDKTTHGAIIYAKSPQQRKGDSLERYQRERLDKVASKNGCSGHLTGIRDKNQMT